jgi:hypothetical protein
MINVHACKSVHTHTQLIFHITTIIIVSAAISHDQNLTKLRGACSGDCEAMQRVTELERRCKDADDDAELADERIDAARVTAGDEARAQMESVVADLNKEIERRTAKVAAQVGGASILVTLYTFIRIFVFFNDALHMRLSDARLKWRLR